jgi:tRNA threonylcarbamoyladenosine biosynthesis protein TsaB
VKRLAIETATAACSVLLEVDGRRLQRSETGARVHARVLLPWIDALLAEAGIGYPALDRIAVDRGPGGFTSLRLGLSVAQGIALAHDLPVHPVSSLAALASQAGAAGARAHVLAVLDARMGEIYAGWYEVDASGTRSVSAEWLGPPDALPRRFDGPFHAIGAGLSRYPGMLADALGGQPASVDPEALPTADAVASLADAVAPVRAHALEPTYLRDRVTG